MNQEIDILKMKLAKVKTSHLLHFFLSLFTGGLWVIVWVVVAAANGSKEKNLENKIRQLGRLEE